jgi:tRNA pseudouridine32 synthase/23S rRNA pseudouridine746 synthase
VNGPAHRLPARSGVSPSCVGLPAGDWPTIADFLVQRFPAISREVWVQRMADGLVADEFGALVTPERPYRGHMRVYYYRALDDEPRVPFEASVLWQDEHLVVADKPHFLPVTPSGHYLQETLLVRLKNNLGLEGLTPIHRIDRETAGLVLFSVQPGERDAYQALFRRHEVSKDYEAIAPWRADIDFPLTRKSRIVQGEPFFRQCEAEGEPNSETCIDVLETAPRLHLARYALSPVTGKKHQLRVHMNALGIPILNDRIYPPVYPTPDDDYTRPLQLLAKALTFRDPFTGETRKFHTRLSLSLDLG